MITCPNSNVKFLIDSNWQFPESIGDEISNHQIQTQLFNICKDLEKRNENELAETIGLLAHVTGMGVQLSEPESPFRSLAEFSNGDRTVNTDDLTDIHLEILKEVLGRTKNLFLLSRFNDVLWVKVRPPEKKYAEEAIKAYLSLTDFVETKMPDKVFNTATSIERAIQIWRQIGSEEIIRKQIENIVIRCMALDKPEPPNFIRYFFFKNLVRCFDEKDAQKWIDLGSTLVSESCAQKNYEKARSYTALLGKIYKRIKDKANWQIMNEKEADLHAHEAREMQAAGAHPMILQGLYNSALEAARNTQGRTAEAKVLKSELIEVQKIVPNDLKEISIPVDLRVPIEEILESVGKVSFKEALELVAVESRPSKKDKLYAQGEQMIKDFPLQSIITTLMLDEKGKIIARKPGMGGGDEEKLAAIRAQAGQHVLMSIEIKGTLIARAQIELNNRTDFDEAVLDQLLYPNPFVPPSRVFQFKKGIMNGLRGDWVSCIYVLVPLLENSLRHVMQLSGHEMVKIDSEGIQQEADLNAFIYSSDFEKVIGQDMAFQLQVILTDKIGINLRNEVAHGLMTDGKALSTVGAYVWSLTLLLCMNFKKKFH